jgi:hypothetical protein
MAEYLVGIPSASLDPGQAREQWRDARWPPRQDALQQYSWMEKSAMQVETVEIKSQPMLYVTRSASIAPEEISAVMQEAFGHAAS